MVSFEPHWHLITTIGNHLQKAETISGTDAVKIMNAEFETFMRDWRPRIPSGPPVDPDRGIIPAFLLVVGLACGVAMVLLESIWPFPLMLLFFGAACVGRVREHRAFLR